MVGTLGSVAREPQVVDTRADASDGTVGGLPSHGPATPAVSQRDVRPQWLYQMQPRLLRLARQFVSNAHDAEEVVQDALTLAWQKVATQWEPARRTAWLYRTTIRMALGRRRRRRLRPLTERVDQRDAADRAEIDELAARVRLVMKQLPARLLAAVVLKEIEGLGYDQIGAILERRPAAVRVMVHRAREKVRRELLRRWPEAFGQA